MIRANVAAFTSGMTGCGKSQLLWDEYESKHPRILAYDPVGDTLDRNPRAVAVRTAEDFRRHVERATSRGCESWHFMLWGGPDEAVKALDMLAPDEVAPNEMTLCRALGGVMFTSGEIDLIASNAGTPLSVKARGKWQRGRHSLLSFAVATQAPALVSRIVSANSHHIYAFGHAEATSLKYFRETIGDRPADVIAGLQQYGFVHYKRGEPFCTEYASDMVRGKIVRRPVRIIQRAIARDEAEAMRNDG